MKFNHQSVLYSPIQIHIWLNHWQRDLSNTCLSLLVLAGQTLFPGLWPSATPPPPSKRAFKSVFIFGALTHSHSPRGHLAVERTAERTAEIVSEFSARQ